MQSFLRPLVLIVFSAVLLAGCQELDGGAKYAVIDTNRVLKESSPGLKSANHLQRVQAEVQAQLRNLRDAAVKEMEGKDPEKDKEAIDAANLQLQESLKQLQLRVQAEQNRIAGIVNDAFRKTVEDYREKNGLALIIGKSNIIAYSVDIDITDEIIREFNKTDVSFDISVGN